MNKHLQNFSPLNSFSLSKVCLLFSMYLLTACQPFEPAISYTVSASSGVGGSITPESIDVPENETTSFTITPDEGYLIDTVSGCNGTLSGYIYTTGSITAACNVIADFKIIARTVTASAGAGGTISPATEIANYGSSISFTVTPDTGYDIDVVSGCQGTLTDNTYTTAPIVADCHISASFKTATYLISTSSGVGGNITPASTVINHGDIVTFTVTPAQSYAIQSVTGCNGSLNLNTFTIGAITADCTISASFTPLLPVLSIGNVSVDEGDSGTTGVIFEFNLNEQALSNITIDFTTVDDTATAGSDYSAINGTLTIPAGSITETLVVPVNGDTTIENDESFFLSLFNASANVILLNDEATATIINDDFPTLGISQASAIEGDSGTRIMSMTVSLSELANGLVNVDYATSNGSATAGTDYIAQSGTLTIDSGFTSGTIDITVNGDTNYEPDETFNVTLSNASANAILTSDIAIGTIRNDDASGLLNDTGVTLCSDWAFGLGGSGYGDGELDCGLVGATANSDGIDGTNGDPVPAGQDAVYGRDLYNPDDSDGHAGFSFTKIDSDGNPLPADASSWECVLDNVTGLFWEVKTNDGGFRDDSNTYTWYDPDPAINGGYPGSPGANTTSGFAEAVNNGGGLCGYTDWRVPTRQEYVQLADYGSGLDSNYFPYPILPNWTSSSRALNRPIQAWRIYQSDGRMDFAYKTFSMGVRLVRGTQFLFDENPIDQACNNTLLHEAPDSRYVVHGDGTVTDSITGLMWKQCIEGVTTTVDACDTGSGSEFAWGNALAQAQSVNSTGFAGYNDWRLPNIKELYSLTEFACEIPTINNSDFPTPGTQSAMWSSTPTTGNSALRIDLSRGQIASNSSGASANHYIRLVRTPTN